MSKAKQKEKSKRKRLKLRIYGGGVKVGLHLCAGCLRVSETI